MRMTSAFARSYSLLDHPEKIIAVYRGWDAFERAHGGPSIIDFDLSNLNDTASFDSRRQILFALEDLRHQIDDSTHEGEFLRDKLQGSIFYLRALMGQQIPFGEYVKYTLGILPEYFSAQEIDDTRSKLNELLAFFGLQLREEDRGKFEAKLVIHDPEEIKRGILNSQEFWLARLREEGIPSPIKLRLNVEFTETDAYWSNWIDGSFTGGIRLRINLHSRKKYELGKPLALCLHEICGHAVQMSIWRELIAQGTINQACGLTTVHSPEMFVAEGLGQTVADLFGSEEVFPREFLLSRWLQYYTLMILHNAHLMTYEGRPVEDILHYAGSNLPFSYPGVLEAEIRDRGTDPLYRTYQLSYAAAERLIRNLIRDLAPQQRRKLFIEMYTRPMTPTQLQGLAARIRSEQL
ncbi:MAG: hypothetical protein AB1671_07550 [Thermodesulfobacteriota bacterium]